MSASHSPSDATEGGGGSGKKQRSGVVGSISFTEDVDPLYNLPYVSIPEAARSSFGGDLVTVKNAALFYFNMHKVLVGRKQKELYVMVSSGGLLMAKKLRGLFARHIPFEKICEIVTNVDKESANKLGGQTGYAPFILFSLVPTEPADLILLADEHTELAVLFTTLIRVWSNNRAYPHVRVKTVEALSLSAGKIDHRVPKSSRNEKPTRPTIQLLMSKQQQRMAFHEMSRRDHPLIDAFVKEKAKEVAERKQLIETSKKLRDAKHREEKAGQRLQEEEEKARKKQEERAAILAAAKAAASSNGGALSDEEMGSPGRKSPSPDNLSDYDSDKEGAKRKDAKISFAEGDTSNTNPNDDSANISLNATANGPVALGGKARRPRSHTLGISDVLKPFLNGNTGQTDVISYMSGGLFSPNTAARFDLPVKMGPARLSYAVSFLGTESKDKRTGIPYASVARKAAKKFPSLAKAPDTALLFFDTVYVNTDSKTLVESYIYFCPERFYVADADEKIRVFVEINDISNLISVDTLQGMNGYEKVSEACVMMLREGMADVLIGFKFPGRREAFAEYLKRACASSNEPTRLHTDTCKTLAETGCDLSGYDDFAEDAPAPSKKEKGAILSPAQIAEQTFPEGEFKVTPQMKIDGPQLAKGWVQWAGYVRHYIDPYPSKKKGRNPDHHFKSLCYVSSTHIYLLRHQTLVRCIDTRYLRRIDVQTLLNKRITDARCQRYILVCDRDSAEFDLCLEHDWEEDSQRCLSAILQAARKTLGSDDSLPKLEPYKEVIKNKYRFLPPNPSYMPEGKDLPMSLEFIQQLGQLRNKIARYFVRNDARRITESLEMAKQHHENADAFFTSLIQQYGVPPERNVNILDYRGRLGRFFGKYAPEAIPRIPTMLEQAKGAEEEMIYRLVLKYGAEPEIPSDDGDDEDNMTQALKRIFQRFDPPRVMEAKEIREKNYGTERELLELLRVQYGAAEDDPLFQMPELLSQEQLLGRPRLRRFCLRYMPDRADDKDLNTLLLSHRGTIDELMRNLVEKYGPEPPSEQSRRSLERLRRFLMKYEPTHPVDDASLGDYYASFPGTEQELFAKLVKKYGPEPLPEGAEELTDLHGVIDLSKELPYADVPDSVGDRFPTLVERPMAIYWFGLVSHWEPPNPATLRYGYVSSTHFYVADGEAAVRRCIPLKAVRAIYINTKRDLLDERQCSVMFQVSSPTEHDLFLTFASDVEAKHMLWIVAEIVAKQNWDGPGLKVLGVKHFDDVDSQVTPHPMFTVDVVPLPHQRLADHPDHTMRGAVAGDKIGTMSIADRLWHTVSKGPNLSGASDVLNNNSGAYNSADKNGTMSINYLDLRKVTFGAGHPNTRAMHGPSAAGGSGGAHPSSSVWAPADAVQLDKGFGDRIDSANGSKVGPTPAAAMFEQRRAISKYSRDGMFGSGGAISPIERDPTINADFVSPSRRPDLAVFDHRAGSGGRDSSSSGEVSEDGAGGKGGHSGVAHFEELDDFDSDDEDVDGFINKGSSPNPLRANPSSGAAPFRGDVDLISSSSPPPLPQRSASPLSHELTAAASSAYAHRQQQFAAANSDASAAVNAYARREAAAGAIIMTSGSGGFLSNGEDEASILDLL